jgi:hypothetical protein
MTMLLACSLLSAALASDGTVITGGDACTIANGHPETGGFYIAGFGLKKDADGNHIKTHNDADDPSEYGTSGLRADDTNWTVGGSYPMDTLGSGVLSHHTCSMQRFSYEADSGSTVYKMKDNATFQACDFTDAVQITEGGTLPSGLKYVDYPFDFDAHSKMYYFASQDGCAAGQKVAIMISSKYESTYDMCFEMGANDRANRIQHCDCDGSKYRMRLSEVCHVGYVDGCVSQQPDDLSCCNEKTVALGYMDYVDGGNCIPKNQKDDMMKTMKEIYDACTDLGVDTKKCDAYLTGDCPWWRQGSPYTGYTYNTKDDSIDGDATTFLPHCEPWYMIAHCVALEGGTAPGPGFTCGDAGVYTGMDMPACNITEAKPKVTEEIHAGSCGASQHLAAWKELLAGTYPAEAKKAADAAAAAATTVAPVTTESFSALAAVGLMLAVLS